MEYIISAIAGMAIFFLAIFLMYNRKQEMKIKRSIRDIKKIRTGSEDSLNFFD